MNDPENNMPQENESPMENHIPDNDQWKLDGNCANCRRKKYCHTQCRANKDRINQRLRKALKESQIGKTLDMLDQYEKEMQ